jgi:succinate dehydrogenase/fumarate reductase flavoprotein subunit
MSKDQQRKDFSRRDFIRTTAAGAGAGIGAITGLSSAELLAQGRGPNVHWDKDADIVVVGAGAAGLPASIAAVEAGSSVILIDANKDVGGHAILSGGNVALGGGTSRQRKYGIEDSPNLLFADLTDWSVVEPNGFPDYRYNDREVIRAYADNAAPTFEFLVAHGVIFVEKAPDNAGANSTGNSVPRENHAAPMAWPQVQTGVPVPTEQGPTGSSGIGLIRPLEVAARKVGVQILLEHRMMSLVRQQSTSGRVLGVRATNQGKPVNIRARKGVVIATGGHSSNVNFRRIFDPRLTEEYQVAGEPWTKQDASGEIAAMAVGASLWGAYNQVGEFGLTLSKPTRIGTQFGYGGLMFTPGSPVWNLARASGLQVRSWQDAILINSKGVRFYDEMGGQEPANNYDRIKPYVHGDYRNAQNMKYNPANWLAAAMAGTGEPVNGGGPIWAIFDAEAVKRENWDVKPPWVDPDGYFFSGATIEELAGKIANKYLSNPIPAKQLAETITRYNSFVDSGTDADFGKPSPKYKIQAPPFYAAWATPIVHDTRSGLRINAKCQVVDLDGNVIPGLYCGGESAGGFSMHGLARCTTQGRIAGLNAAKEMRT